MFLVSMLLVALLFIAVGVLLHLYLRERAIRRQHAMFGDWPIRTVPLEQIDPIFRAGPFGPGIETEILFIFKGHFPVEGGTTDIEAAVLAVLAKTARQLFEFGTCTGKTAYLWARNSPPGARVTTLTLPPEKRSDYHSELGDDATDADVALRESAFATFLYSGTEAEAKIEQLYGDSKALDISRWGGTCDLVFVDGSHAYSYVVSDSAKALELVRPGGLVLWHDYAGARHSPGVYRALNELSKRLPLVRLAGTKLVAYRRPAG
jgi:predicted O-methyltransferase YrrM